MGRREYDNELARSVGRVEGKLDTALAHLERINGRLGRAETRLDDLESVDDTEKGQRSERSRWIGWGGKGAVALIGLDFVQRRATDVLALLKAGQ